MQIFSATTLLYARVVLLLVIAFILATDPLGLVSANFMIMLGQAMELPIALVSKENPMLGITSMVFGSLALSDLIPLLADNLLYFESIVPVRLTLSFALGAYTYISDYEVIANNLVFVYAFFEIWFNFLVFNNLRDEKYYRLKKYAEEHAEEIKEQEGVEVRVAESYR